MDVNTYAQAEIDRLLPSLYALAQKAFTEASDHDALRRTLLELKTIAMALLLHCSMTPRERIAEPAALGQCSLF